MSCTVVLRDKAEIERHLRHNIYLHLFEIGDLDDFFWPSTTWYALKDDNQVRELALLYRGSALPVLLAFGETPQSMRLLLQSLIPQLPKYVYAHLFQEAAEVLANAFDQQSHGIFWKMALTRPDHLEKVDVSEVVRLSPSDQRELERLFKESYPGNWFDPRLLETGCYYGFRMEGRLVSTAGVHVYSPSYKVAALGNVATHPAWRGRGLATRVCARLCMELMAVVQHIGLNVSINNSRAIACYQHIGFEQVATYEECMLIGK